MGRGRTRAASRANASRVAHAASIPHRQNRLDVKRFARDWWAYDWGARPDCYGVRLYWNSARSMRYYTGRASTLAFVPPNRPCGMCSTRAWTGRDTAAELRRSVVALLRLALHEYGHLVGMPFDGTEGPLHSRNPNSIMAASEQLNTYAWWWPYFPGCRLTATTLTATATPTGSSHAGQQAHPASVPVRAHGDDRLVHEVAALAGSGIRRGGEWPQPSRSRRHGKDEPLPKLSPGQRSSPRRGVARGLSYARMY